MSEAERQNYLATEEAQRAVHVCWFLMSRSYFNQQLAYAQLQIAEETLRNYQQSYAFVEKQLLTGSSNVLALEQAGGVIESTRSDIAKRRGNWRRRIMHCNCCWEATASCRKRRQ
ncbi:hypothetical protein ACLK2A_03220 [Escherichia coli]